MEQQETYALREIFRSRVTDSFARARACLRRARQARQEGDTGRLRKLVACTRILRAAAAGWRERAQSILPVLLVCLASLVGCTKEAPRAFSARFQASPSPNGTGVQWSLSFTTGDYHAAIDSAPDGMERAKVRELIADALRVNHLEGCSATEKFVVRQKNGDIAFVGSCTLARAIPAGGI